MAKSIMCGPIGTALACALPTARSEASKGDGLFSDLCTLRRFVILLMLHGLNDLRLLRSRERTVHLRSVELGCCLLVVNLVFLSAD